MSTTKTKSYRCYYTRKESCKETWLIQENRTYPTFISWSSTKPHLKTKTQKLRRFWKISVLSPWRRMVCQKTKFDNLFKNSRKSEQNWRRLWLIFRRKKLSWSEGTRMRINRSRNWRSMSSKYSRLWDRLGRKWWKVSATSSQKIWDLYTRN